MNLHCYTMFPPTSNTLSNKHSLFIHQFLTLNHCNTFCAFLHTKTEPNILYCDTWILLNLHTESHARRWQMMKPVVFHGWVVAVRCIFYHWLMIAVRGLRIFWLFYRWVPLTLWHGPPLRKRKTTFYDVFASSVATWQNLMRNWDEDKTTVDESGRTINYVYQRSEYPMHALMYTHIHTKYFFILTQSKQINMTGHLFT